MCYIELHNVCKRYPSGCGTIDILSNISFTVNRGEFVAITGPSGCGKSTLLHMIGGLSRPTLGDILIHEQSLYEKSSEERSYFRRSEAGIIYQFYNLIPELTAEENLMLPALMNHQKVDVSYLNEILDFLDMRSQRCLYPRQLSGGQQQKIAVGRALIYHPKLLLADEPTGNLDTRKRDEILGLFCYLNKHESMTILLVTHDPVVADTADRCIGLLNGEITKTEDIGLR